MGAGATVAHPAVSDACCAVERFAVRNVTAPPVDPLIVTIRRFVSQPVPVACTSSLSAADQRGAFSGLPFASTGKAPVLGSSKYFLTSPHQPASKLARY